MPRYIKATFVFLCLSLFLCSFIPTSAFSFSLFKKNDKPVDRFKKNRTPTVEPLDHMPKGEREDWEYNLFNMDEPEEFIIMFEQTTKRYPVPIDETSENLTVITRRRIERMNAHSVSEVLKRVCGVFVNSTTGELGELASLSIENSNRRHVLVLLDGVPINYLASGLAETNLIPVGIIEKIEILKGPASSVWGSSLGGVINIITRIGGEDLDTPANVIGTTYGEKNTTDFRATISKKFVDKYSILFNANSQKTDGIVRGRGFKKDSLFFKFNTADNENAKASFTTLFSEATTDEPTSTLDNSDSEIKTDLFLSNINFEFIPHEKLTLNLSGFHLKNNFDTTVVHPDYNYNDILDDTTTGISGKMHIKMWGLSTTTMGFDFSNHRVTMYDWVDIYGDDSDPYITETDPHYEKYAFYLNQTYDFYHFMILPGIRIDYNDISKEFWSPSLGFSLNLSDDFVVRLTAARGFSAPPVAWISQGFWNYEANPDLKREEVWSYQAGFESTEFWFMAIKSNYFYHDLDKQIDEQAYTPVNLGKVIRQGFELEITTKAFYKFMLYGNGAYVHTKNKSTHESKNTNAGNIGVRYNNRKTFRYELNGHFQDLDPDKNRNYSKTDMIWDFTLSKTFKFQGNHHLELIGKVHNIFDGKHFYANRSAWQPDDKRNPDRWVEIGANIKF